MFMWEGLWVCLWMLSRLSLWGFRNTFCHLQINKNWKNNIHRLSKCHMYNTSNKRYSPCLNWRDCHKPSWGNERNQELKGGRLLRSGFLLGFCQDQLGCSPIKTKTQSNPVWFMIETEQGSNYSPDYRKPNIIWEFFTIIALSCAFIKFYRKPNLNVCDIFVSSISLSLKLFQWC